MKQVKVNRFNKLYQQQLTGAGGHGDKRSLIGLYVYSPLFFEFNFRSPSDFFRMVSG